MSAATGALKPVLEKLTALTSDEYKRFKRVRREVQSLTDELAAMHSFLLRMSEEENPDPQDKNWMKKVRELSYDMEDSLDEFMHHVDDKSISPEGLLDKFKTFLMKARNRRRIAKAVEDLKVQVKEVGDRNKRYKSNEAIMNTSNASTDHRALAIFVDASKLVGIDKPKDELMKWLTRKYQGVASEPLEEVEPPKVVYYWIWRNGKDNTCKPSICRAKEPIRLGLLGFCVGGTKPRHDDNFENNSQRSKQ